MLKCRLLYRKKIYKGPGEKRSHTIWSVEAFQSRDLEILFADIRHFRVQFAQEVVTES